MKDISKPKQTYNKNKRTKYIILNQFLEEEGGVKNLNSVRQAVKVLNVLTPGKNPSHLFLRCNKKSRLLGLHHVISPLQKQSLWISASEKQHPDFHIPTS